MDTLDLSNVPAKALNYTTRRLLGQYLNPEQLLLTDGVSRDYNGLAEEMGFNFTELRNFQRYDNPTLKILEAWTDRPNTTFGQLIQCLENIGRHDVLEDVYPRLENDARLYSQRNLTLSQESPLQVPEVTSCRIPDSRIEDSGILTREDAHTGEYTKYDAFVCYADEDIVFVDELARFLELVGFKLFIRHRDLLAGHSEYETSMQLIQERCKRVLIILSPDFLKCPACEVQSTFAAGLGIDERCRKLIPIVYKLLKPCEVPLMIRFISKIDFTRPGVKDWIWDKLISSLQDGPSSTFISSDKRYPTICNSINFQELPAPDSSNPAITFPSTSSLSIASTPAVPSITFPPTISSVVGDYAATNNFSSSSIVFQEEPASEPTTNVNKTSSKNKNKLLKFFKLPKKVDASHNNDSIASTSYSNITSGIYSQGSYVSESVIGLGRSTNQNNVVNYGTTTNQNDGVCLGMANNQNNVGFDMGNNQNDAF